MDPKLYLSLRAAQERSSEDPQARRPLDPKLVSMAMNPVRQDNTRVDVRSVSPQTREAVAYYNPPVRDASSGNDMIDLLYRNQWMMDVPGLGNAIKNVAYNAATQSKGNPTITESVKPFSSGAYAGQNYDSDDGNAKNMLDVYFGRQELPPSQYKPTSDYMEFLPSYSIKGNFDQYVNERKTVEGGDIFDEVLFNVFNGTNRTMDEFIKTKKPVYRSMPDNSELASILGADLGGHKLGIAWDKEKNLPYVSISDAWDFEPRAYAEKWKDESTDDEAGSEDRAYVQASLMHKAGRPFKVYDRFYFDPSTKKYIPDAEVEKLKSK